jgi:hypothetical protein
MRTNNIVTQLLGADMMKNFKCVHQKRMLRLTDLASRGVVVVLADSAAWGTPWFGVGAESNLTEY